MQYKNTYHWIFQNKWRHLLFWLLYTGFWSTVLLYNNVNIQDIEIRSIYFIRYFLNLISICGAAFFCIYYIFPTYLYKKKYAFFVAGIAAAVSIATFFIYTLNIILIYFWDITKFQQALSDFETIDNALRNGLGCMTVAVGIQFYTIWKKNKEHQELLEKEKLETELKFLKSQFNPHFLFNTINSIFVLINKNENEATEALEKFSSLLRYQLYECNETKIPLERELSYLTSYIQLEKLRQNDTLTINDRLKINYASDFGIAPFILMPFIENAFKHVSRSSLQDNWIHIQVDLEDDKLYFQIANSIDQNQPQSKDAIHYGGLGLKNVKRRLNLMYQHHHELAIEKTATAYEVNLTIRLSTYEVSSKINYTIDQQ